MWRKLSVWACGREANAMPSDLNPIIAQWELISLVGAPAVAP